jgi:hypothetical protein
MQIVIHDYQPKAECQLSGKKDCECVAIQSPPLGGGAAMVSFQELTKLVRLYHRMETAPSPLDTQSRAGSSGVLQTGPEPISHPKQSTRQSAKVVSD